MAYLGNVQKKADIAWVFSRKHPDVIPYYNRLSLLGRLSISQTVDAYTKRIAIFAGAEVKKAGGNENESAAQLAIWSAAGIRMMRVLQQMAQTPELGLETPPISGQEMPRSGSASSSADVLGRGPEAAKAMTGDFVDMPPVIGWCIIGHRWLTYIAWRKSRDTDDVVS